MRSLCVFSYEPVASVSLVHVFGVWLTHVNTGLFARKFHSSVPIMILFLDNGFGDPQLFSRICTNFTCTVLIKFEIKMTSKLLDGLWLNLSGRHIHVHIKMSTRTLVSKPGKRECDMTCLTFGLPEPPTDTWLSPYCSGLNMPIIIRFYHSIRSRHFENAVGKSDDFSLSYVGMPCFTGQNVLGNCLSWIENYAGFHTSVLFFSFLRTEKIYWQKVSRQRL